MNLYCEEPLDDAELDEIEKYTIEALGYRHQPEFVHECARLIAEVRRLRGLNGAESRSTFARLKDLFSARSVPTLEPAVSSNGSNGAAGEPS